MYVIQPTRPADSAGIEALLDLAFGPDRWNKISYRYRRGVAPQPGLSFVAREKAPGRPLVGSIAYWPVAIGETDGAGLLLGPLAIRPDRQGRGIGAALMARSLEAATLQGHGCVFLVGDLGYYARFGFAPAAPRGLMMPDEAPERLLVRALRPGTVEACRGSLEPWRGLRRGAVTGGAVAA